jgi:hypothetical protein
LFFNSTSITLLLCKKTCRRIKKNLGIFL